MLHLEIIVLFWDIKTMLERAQYSAICLNLHACMDKTLTWLIGFNHLALCRWKTSWILQFSVYPNNLKLQAMKEELSHVSSVSQHLNRILAGGQEFLFLLSLAISRMGSLIPIHTKLSFSYLVLPHDLLSFSGCFPDHIAIGTYLDPQFTWWRPWCPALFLLVSTLKN